MKRTALACLFRYAAPWCLLLASILAVASAAEPVSSPVPTEPLWIWQTAVARLEYVRGLIGENRYDEALKNFGKIFSQFPAYQEIPWAMCERAEALKKHGRYDEAIEILKRVAAFADHPAESWFPSFNWNEQTASLTSECYEAKGDFAQALKHARMTEGIQGTGGCLNCMLASEATQDLRIARLMLIVGDTEAGLKRAEHLLNGRGGRECEGAELIVRHFHRRGKLDEMEQRLKKLEADAEVKRQAKLGKEMVFPIVGARLAREYATILKLADRGDVAALWKRLEKLTAVYQGYPELNCFAFDFYDSDPPSSSSDSEDSWLRGKVVAAIESLGNESRPFLLSKMHTHNRMQGWALVLLAKLRAPQAMEKIRGELAADKQRPQKLDADGVRIEEERAEEHAMLRRDYLYALSFVKTSEAVKLLDSLCADKDERWSAAATAVKESISRTPVADETE